MQLIETATKEQVVEAIRRMKVGGIMLYFSSYTAFAREALDLVVILEPVDTEEDHAPRKIIKFLTEQLEKM